MTEQNVTPVFDGNDTVNTICDSDKKDEAHEFLSGLADRNKAKFQYYLTLLRDGHHVKSPENMRHIDYPDPLATGAELHELKVHRDGGLRLYVIHFNNRWYITHGVAKMKDRHVNAQAEKAFRIFHGA